MPRDMWEVLPGGMPYYVVDLAGGRPAAALAASATARPAAQGRRTGATS